MKPVVELDIDELNEFLLAIGTIKPVFIWGPPGIGKSSIVEQFSESLGMECVPLLGSQLLGEDLIGVPRVEGEVTRFIPTSLIYRKNDFCLFLDELNLSSPEILKAFYSLINDKRVGEYTLPKGSIVIGAGNRAADSALVRQLPSALVNRMIHVHLKVNHRIWLKWAIENKLHPLVIDYLTERPKHLNTLVAPGNEEPFSTPRMWEIVSDGLYALDNSNNQKLKEALIYGALTHDHAQSFFAFIKKQNYKYNVEGLLKGKIDWPSDPKDRDILIFLISSLKEYLLKELPKNNDNLTSEKKKLVIDFKNCLKKLSYIDNELAQQVLSESEDGDIFPIWFLTEITKEFPRLMLEKNEKK